MRWIYLVLTWACVSLWPAGLMAVDVEVIANFDGGNSTTIVDAFEGMGGDGWDSPWTIAAPSRQTVAATAVVPGDSGFTELVPGSGSYLSYQATGTSTTLAGSSAVTRNYAASGTGIDLTLPHSVEFTVRIDEDLSTFTNYADRYYFYDLDVVRNGSSGGCRWIIAAYGNTGDNAPAGTEREWTFYNGDQAGGWVSTIDTNIALTAGGVYEFTVNVDPATQTWDCTVSDGSTSFTETGLAWRNAGPDSGGYLGFNARNNNNSDTRAISLDRIRLSQTSVTPPGGLLQVAARFDGGNTDAVVDAYVGKAGNGWGGPWIRLGPEEEPGAATTKVVMPGDADFQVVDEGAYLEHAVTGARSAVIRNYTSERPSIDFLTKHTISFKIRIDEDVDSVNSLFTDFDDRYYFFDTPDVRDGTDATCTWIITAFGAAGSYAGEEIVGEWSFYDGDNDGGLLIENNVDTDIAITTGGVYEFTLVIDPENRSYDATVSDGNRSFTATGLGWRSESATVGGNLTFATRVSDTSDPRAFSLDSLVISQVPEPTTGLLAVAGILCLGLLRANRRVR